MKDNSYRKLMEQQCLSEQSVSSFYEKLQSGERQKTHSGFAKIALIAVCFCLLVPISAYAVESIFGISIVDWVDRTTSKDQPGTGYDIYYEDLKAHSISDVSEDLRTLEGNVRSIHSNWQDAENELGIQLVNSPFFTRSDITKENAYDLRYDGIFERVHCFADYEGRDAQIYSASVTAAYRYEDFSITLRSAITFEHPTVSKDEADGVHEFGVTYPNSVVEIITKEQYTATNGINATIITIDRKGNKTTDYEACFAANEASYRITIHSYEVGQDEEAKALLIEILETFVFE